MENLNETEKAVLKWGLCYIYKNFKDKDLQGLKSYIADNCVFYCDGKRDLNRSNNLDSLKPITKNIFFNLFEKALDIKFVDNLDKN